MRVVNDVKVDVKRALAQARSWLARSRLARL
jgi:hypothetical protein